MTWVLLRNGKKWQSTACVLDFDEIQREKGLDPQRREENVVGTVSCYPELAVFRCAEHVVVSVGGF